MTVLDITREQIIEAGRARFAHYGYAKTTMAELARDCDMSPGNLYRFFAGKLEIAEEICHRASLRTADELASILGGTARSATERLHDFLFMDLRATYHALEKDEKIVEMAQIVTAQRPEFHNEGLLREREVLSKILAMGVQAGEFLVADPDMTAEMIQAATMKFSYPQLFTRLSLEKLERELQGVYEIISRGIKA
ncbi:MAG: TetR/AcrR family transcriptional regulator [Rhodobiaceae bacterium]|nr:TetR/AcrR family transcriptional regulator [Rhodobiaceae bacterium]